MNCPDEILDLNNFEMQECFTEAENTLQLKLFSIVPKLLKFIQLIQHLIHLQSKTITKEVFLYF